MTNTEQADDNAKRVLIIECPYCTRAILHMVNAGVSFLGDNDQSTHVCRDGRSVTIKTNIVVRDEEES